MRVAHVVVSVSRKSGGLFHSVAGMAKAEAELPGMEVHVHGVEDEFSAADAPSWQPLVPQIHAAAGPAFLGWAPAMKKRLMRGDYDVVHNHGLWQHISRVGMSWQRSRKKPHIVSPRGMLDPWALANSGWKKRLAAAAFENRHLREATCLHALCAAEANAMRAYGLDNPIAVVPNGVVLPQAKQRSVQCSVSSVQPENHTKTKTLLFLGRLHPKKGLPEALRAWAEVTRGAETGWRFVIAGWDQGGHEVELKRTCGELGVRYAECGDQRSEDRDQQESLVVFAGPAFGETKDALLRSADAFILPSLSEGLPMSVLEAWAYGLPVLMTDECNLPEGFAEQAAIKIDAAAPSGEWREPESAEIALRQKSAESKRLEVGGQKSESRRQGPEMSREEERASSVSAALRELMGMTDAQREAMGMRGRALVEERFTWPKVAAQMKEVYEWVSGNGPQPDFVRVAGN